MMQTLLFEIKGSYLPKKEQFIKDVSNMYELLENGKYELVIRKPTRTKRQNAALHAFFRRAAREMDGIVPLQYGGLEVKWSEERVKDLFCIVMLDGGHTSKQTTKQLSEAIDGFVDILSKKGCQISVTHEDIDHILKYQ